MWVTALVVVGGESSSRRAVGAVVVTPRGRRRRRRAAVVVDGVGCCRSPLVRRRGRRVGAVVVGPVLVGTVVVGTVVVVLAIAGTVVVDAVVVAPTVGGTVLGGGTDIGIVEVGATDVNRVVVAETTGALVVCGPVVAATVGGTMITRPLTDTGAGGALKSRSGRGGHRLSARRRHRVEVTVIARATAAAEPANRDRGDRRDPLRPVRPESIPVHDTVPRRRAGTSGSTGQLEASRDAVGPDRPALRQVFRRVPLAVARAPPAGVGRAATRHIAFLRIDARQVDAGEATLDGTVGFRR